MRLQLLPGSLLLLPLLVVAACAPMRSASIDLGSEAPPSASRPVKAKPPPKAAPPTYAAQIGGEDLGGYGPNPSPRPSKDRPIKLDGPSHAGSGGAKADLPGDVASAPRPAPVAPASSAPDSQGTVWCAIARMRMNKDACDDLAAQRASLVDGVAAFNPPRHMVVGRASRVTLPIGATNEAAQVVGTAGGADHAVTIALKIGRFMRATLTGSAFKIVPVGSPDRDLGMSTRDEWRWDVTPQAEGPQTLQVEVETFAEDAAHNRTRIDLFHSDPIAIDVDVTVGQRRDRIIGEADKTVTQISGLTETLTKWLGALAALVLAAGVLAWRLRNFGHKAPASDPKPE